MLSTTILSSTRRTWKNDKNNVPSRYAEYNYKLQKHSTASQRHCNKFHACLALIPVSTDPDGVRTDIMSCVCLRRLSTPCRAIVDSTSWQRAHGKP